jgi:hypothetical protein
METIESKRTAADRLAAAISRAKLTEPVRLYLGSVGAVIVAGLVLAGWLTQDWAAYCMAALGVILGLGPAGYAIRASVWSEAAHITSLRQLHSIQDVQRALGEAA